VERTRRQPMFLKEQQILLLLYIYVIVSQDETATKLGGLTE